MARINLRAAFALGLQSSISAQQVFTNRVSEVAAFDASLRELETYLDATEISPVVDRSLPRKNVLVYYGVGGIGKSTLSQELERRFVPRDAKGKPKRTAVRFDFADSSTFDLESYILRLRAGLAQLAASWPAFDMALGGYWARAHPGEPLDEFISNDSALSRAARRIGLSDQISSTMTDMVGVGDGITGAGLRIASAAYRRIKDGVSNNRTLRNCELLPELLEADADLDTLSYLPYLLAWDLDRLPAPRLKAVVFIDTYEAITSRTTREVERWLQRSVFLMPNTLFVITGRNRLDWAELDHADELDFVGVERWPYLNAGQTQEPRQHLVGYLSKTDTRSHLEKAVVENEEPAIPSDIRERIADASGGFPLYLDLSITRYLDLLARGRTPTVEDFGQPLPSVAGKILQDLGNDERQLLRAAALLDGFDMDLLRAACPQVPDGALRRFRDRPFLEVDSERTWRYSLHDVLRESIREADISLADSWSERERNEVVARIAEHLKAVAERSAESGDRSTEVAVLRQTIDLCLLTGQFFDWIIDVAQRLLMSGHWNSFSDRRQVDGSAVSALLLGLWGARERRSGRVKTAIEATNAALDYPEPTEKLRCFLTLHHAHALRVAGRYADAAIDYENLWRSSGDFSAEAGYWLSDYSYLDGRFDDALGALDQLPDPSAELEGEVLRLRGHIYRVNASFSTAESHYRQALELARHTNNVAAEGKALTDLVQTLAWTQPDEALRIHPLAVEINESLRNRVELVKLHAAASVALSRNGAHGAAELEATSGLSLTADYGYTGGRVWCWVARALTAVRRQRPDDHRAATDEISAIVDELGGNRFWADIALWLAGTENPSPTATRWIDGPAPTMQRWMAVGAGE